MEVRENSQVLLISEAPSLLLLQPLGKGIESFRVLGFEAKSREQLCLEPPFLNNAWVCKASLYHPLRELLEPGEELVFAVAVQNYPERAILYFPTFPYIVSAEAVCQTLPDLIRREEIEKGDFRQIGDAFALPLSS